VIFYGVRSDIDATDTEHGVANAIGVRYYKGQELQRRLRAQKVADINASNGLAYAYNPVTGGFYLALSDAGNMEAMSA
jgi:hypothetical protein